MSQQHPGGGYPGMPPPPHYYGAGYPWATYYGGVPQQPFVAEGGAAYPPTGVDASAYARQQRGSAAPAASPEETSEYYNRRVVAYPSYPGFVPGFGGGHERYWYPGGYPPPPPQYQPPAPAYGRPYPRGAYGPSFGQIDPSTGHDYRRLEDGGTRVDEPRIHEILAKRLRLKMDRKFAEADRLRDQLEEMGVMVHDREKTWEVRRSRAPRPTDKEPDSTHGTKRRRDDDDHQNATTQPPRNERKVDDAPVPAPDNPDRPPEPTSSSSSS